MQFVNKNMLHTEIWKKNVKQKETENIPTA